MSLQGRIRKLRRQVPGPDVLEHPDGRVIELGPTDGLDAVLAAVDGEEHWLLPHLLELDTTEGLAGLCRALTDIPGEVRTW